MHPAAEVLLIEDDDVDRRWCRSWWRSRDAAACTSPRPRPPRGLALLDARPFDLVMLDTRLRDASALAALRASGSTRPTRRSCRTPRS